jgi:hypothetical protein
MVGRFELRPPTAKATVEAKKAVSKAAKTVASSQARVSPRD